MTKTERLLYKAVGGNVRRYRKRCRMSQECLAEEIGLSRTSVVNLEQGNQATPLDTLYSIAFILGVSIRRLIPEEIP